ncbi:hypothetical protein [Archaeoglobus veneficus]|uniref:Uncharacterized protein n=1 Tax=Archaeoglobus veneficus (strain DSM 11195 / SNP6) TaxID=693661 RepID=F2KSJ0_ARCVS|nr:hypothetical protein [Archaeoglobus veneficus]AEA48060.1 hypothetical protein Arcve_2070 [Archaeoglobus veneficus SNP6]
MLQELAMLRVMAGTKRERRVAKEGSEDIPIELNIAAGGFEVIDYEQHEVAKRYLPLNEIITINVGSVPVKVLYNQSEYDADYVPAGGVIKQEHKSVRSLKVVNLDSTNAAKVIVRAKKKPITTNDVVRMMIP